ncbi:MAG: hypothetical protein OWQ57_08800 [Sulfobacillus sp.]|nr:hypothetical protein [Sulfobacillus sp.]
MVIRWPGAILMLALFNDWPWLLLFMAVQWMLARPHWPGGPALLVGELTVVVLVEAGLAWALPPEHGLPLIRRLSFSGGVLGVFSLWFGLLPAMGLWQVMLGGDARYQMRHLGQWTRRILWLRGIRVGVGLILWWITSRNGLS